MSGDTLRAAQDPTTADHSALVAKVTERLHVAEQASEGFLAAAHPVLLSAKPADAMFLAAHSPSFAILVHRQALETLNRHAPDEQVHGEGYYCTGCGLNSYEELRYLYADCPEVAGVRAVYLPEASDGQP